MDNSRDNYKLAEKPKKESLVKSICDYFLGKKSSPEKGHFLLVIFNKRAIKEQMLNLFDVVTQCTKEAQNQAN